MAKSEKSDGSQANTDAFEAAIAISALRDSMSRAKTRRKARSRYCGVSTSMVGQKSWGPKVEGQSWLLLSRNSRQPY
jgi:hypothetical protein